MRENTDRYLAIRTSNQGELQYFVYQFNPHDFPAAMATILGDRAYLSADKEKTSTK